MQNLKIKVNNEAESKEVQELLFELGYEWHGKGKIVSYLNNVTNGEFDYLVAWSIGCFTNFIQMGCGKEDAKETTIAELRSMVKPMKEYLIPSRNYEYILTDAREALEPHAKDWICIPKGADFYVKSKFFEDSLFFCKDNLGIIETFDTVKENSWHQESTLTTPNLSNNYDILWQRPTQPEALPFIDDETQSLNDQYAEIEQVRQSLKDNVNHPNHYTKGKVECLDALESATIGKSGIEAVCVANIIKYLWRYEEKNGLEDIKKANFYLNRLLATLENNNG